MKRHGADLPMPEHFRPERVGEIWPVRYQDRAADAAAWKRAHGIRRSSEDRFRVGLLLVDVQNTFCVPGFELFVGGTTGTAAVEDNRRLCEFLYRNLGRITTILPTMDTHGALQIFHSLFLADEDGNPPDPYTVVSATDVEEGKWQVREGVAEALGFSPADLRTHLSRYTATLAREGRYELTVWPYHALLGGIGHALVPAVEEAVFFHSLVRISRPEFQLKGEDPLTESYSAFGPDVALDVRGRPVGALNDELFETLAHFDAVIVAGQAKSHCVSWTVSDLMRRFEGADPAGAHRVYLLEDCCSPVVVPGVIDYSRDADEAFDRFEAAGMNRVRSTVPIAEWPGAIAAIDGAVA